MVDLSGVLGPILQSQYLPGIKVLSTFTDPSQIPMSEAQRAEQSTALSQQQTERDIAKGTNQLGVLNYLQNRDLQQQQIQQKNIELQQNQHRLDTEDQTAAATNQGRDIENQQKLMDYKKQQVLLQASQQGGPDGYMQALSQIDPAKFQEMQKAKIGIQTDLIGQDKSLFDLSKSQREDVVKQSQDIGSIMQQVKLAGPNGEQLYNKALPLIKQYMPSAPDSYNSNFVDAAVMASGSIMQNIAKVGALTPIDRAMLPNEVQQGLSQSLQSQSSNGAPIPGMITSPDQKTRFADVLDTSKGVEATPGTPAGGSSRTAGPIAISKSIITSLNDIQDSIGSSKVPLTTNLPNLLNSTAGITLKAQLSSAINQFAALRKQDPKQIEAEMIGPTDTVGSLQSKIHAMGREANMIGTTQGENEQNMPKVSTGIKDPTSGKTLTTADIETVAKKYNIPYEKAYESLNNFFAQQGK